jgi:alpha-glucosidase (family GH31 glycosyl hydrolase)
MKTKMLLLAAVSIIAHTAYSQHRASDPKADSAAMITVGDVRFTVLTPELVRMEWNSTSQFEDRASLIFINRKVPVPRYEVQNEDEWLTITTDKLTLRFKKRSGKFSERNLSIEREVNGLKTRWHPGLRDSLNLKGTTRTLDGTDGEKDVQLEDGLLSRSGWSIVDDSQGPLFDGSDWDWVVARQEGERQDWYFFGYGHNYKKALSDYTQIAGKIPMPPKFAFGYWWSRYWTYSDRELRTLVSDMKHYGVPIDVLIIDMEWHDTYGISGNVVKRDPFGQHVGWTGYTWNKTLFPEPAQFLKWTEGQDLQTALNLHPASGIAPMEERYYDFAKAYGFDTTGRPYIPFRMEEKKWATTYFDNLLRPFEKDGIDFWWIDWQQWLENKTVKGLSNTWWLNYTFFTSMERHGERRPLLFHRWGGLGNHRYQIGFSGDTHITWSSLDFQPYFTSTAGNLGYGYWSHDIGGHMGGIADPELYLRWIQYGIFSPIVRTHSTKSPTIERRIWRHTDQFELMRNALQFRYGLAPYIYTASREAYETGVSLCRPLYYEYPELPQAYDFKNEYFFGPDLLVAPVTQKADSSTGLSAKTVWLPEGEWYEWFTGTILKGGQILERSFALNEIPLYARAGSIIPMYPDISSLQHPVDTLVLSLVPGSHGSARIYEDDGTTSEYKTNQYAFTRIVRTLEKDSSTKITVFPREGSFKGMASKRSYEIQLLRSYPPVEVRINGKACLFSAKPKAAFWTYDGTQLMTAISVPPVPCKQKTEIVVRWSSRERTAERHLNGKIGLFGRMPKIAEAMKAEVNRRDWAANAPDPVLYAANLPMMITYHPEKTIEYLTTQDGKTDVLVRSIMDFPRGDNAILESIVRQLPSLPPIVSAPQIKLERSISDRSSTVEMNCQMKAASIRYTLDGSIPDETSTAYSVAFAVDKTSTITAKAFQNGMTASFPVTAEFQLVYAKSVKYEQDNSPRYTGGSPLALVNGKFGKTDEYAKDWVGFQQVDFGATIELSVPRVLKSIAARFLDNQPVWIFLPTRVTIEISADGAKFVPVLDRDTKEDAEHRSDIPSIRTYAASFAPQQVSHVRIRADNLGICPAWHRGAGGKAWLFVDEIIVE